MNNNRGNNRRRGRGNNNNRQQGGGQQLNRIDSRARGNAPQLLEKYKKLAHDAHLNGDRVTEEYNLQFADHYFRVMADTRLRQEEQRTRRDDRWQEGGEGYREEADDAGEFSVEGEYSPYDQPNYGSSNSNSGGNGNSSGNTGNRREREERPRREERAERPERPERAERVERAERPEQEAPSEDIGDEQQEQQRSPYEPPENPFVRENRPARGLRARREDRRPRGEDKAEASAPADEAAPEQEEAAPSFDPNLLPPSISTAREEAPAEEVAEAKPRRRTRRKPSADDAGEALESVS